MGDGVTAAMGGQKLADGYYKLDNNAFRRGSNGGRIGCCGTCMDARGITDALLTGAAKRFTWRPRRLDLRSRELLVF